MIVDCFPFFNELEMLECRLEYLNNKVDKFVLVESYTTHMGKPKPLYFEENKQRFEKYLDKIIHIKHHISVSKPDYNFDLSKGTDNAAWEADTDQRNAVLKGTMNLPDDAIIMVSDVDEIPNLEAIDRAVRLLNNRHFVFLETKFFMYNLGQHLVERWPATSLIKNHFYKTNKIKPQDLRNGKDAAFRVLNGGWHLSYFGDISRIQTKIKNFTHQEFNTEQFTDPEWIKKKIEEGVDLYDRKFPMMKSNIDELPEDFLRCFKRFMPQQLIQETTNVMPLNCQLGCGFVIADNYLNIDFLDLMFENKIETTDIVKITDKTNCYFLKHDATKRIPLAEQQFQTVYHSHFLEHVNPVEGYNVLVECFRILKPGGTLRILVPDLEFWVDAYYNKKQEFLNWYKDKWLGDSVLTKTSAQIFMGALHNHEHKMGYDFETLKHILESIGFNNVVRTEYGVSNIPEIDFLECPDDPKRPESLCVECTRPLVITDTPIEETPSVNTLSHYAENVEGWFSPEDMQFYKKVVEQASNGAHFVEVGSYKGRSSSFMAVEIALSEKQIKFDCVDTWKGSEEHIKGGIFEDPDVVNNRLYDEFLKNMEPVKDHYTPIRMTSLEAASLYQDNSLDFVFIDAAHDYENVLNDILAWSAKVKSGGIISGHDFHHPPIQQAVSETVGEANSFGGCWYVFKA